MIFLLFAHPLENFFFRNTDCLVLNTWEKHWGIICAYNYVIMELFSFIYKGLYSKSKVIPSMKPLTKKGVDIVFTMKCTWLFLTICFIVLIFVNEWTHVKMYWVSANWSVRMYGYIPV